MPDHHTDINIRETINSGQVFLWENYKNTWFVIDGHDIIMARQTPFEVLTFSKKAKNFFREDDSYEKILKNIKGNPKVLTVHGDENSCTKFAEEIQEKFGLDAYAPKLGEEIAV